MDACPARVCLIEIPSRNEVRVRNLFNVADCKLHWQKSGEHLCVKVDRYGKKKIENNEPKYSVSITAATASISNVLMNLIKCEVLSSFI